jgi:hypothetical protein
MDNEREQKIRERAHALWEQEGSPEGRHAEHWATAEREFDKDEAGAVDPSSAISHRDGKSPLADPGSPGGTAGTGGTSHDQDR